MAIYAKALPNAADDLVFFFSTHTGTGVANVWMDGQ